MLVEFDGAATLDAFMDLRDLLEQLTGRRVDLVTDRAVKPLLEIPLGTAVGADFTADGHAPTA